MNNRLKNALYSFVLLAAILLVWKWRNPPERLIMVEGQTMGTTYHVSYFDKANRNFKISIDSILLLVNKCINNYDSAAAISVFNTGRSGYHFRLPYFYPPVSKAMEVAQASGGAFDPTVMPLVYRWGFGKNKNMQLPDSAQIDSIRQFVGFDKIRFNADSVWKTDPRVQLDFGGIGQGYGADVITGFLKSKGIADMLVELGGEGMAIGKNVGKGKVWEIGILDPNSTRDSLFYNCYVNLENKGFSTSGNYFNYRIVDGKKFSHTIDPATGYPVQRSILSATVFAADCITADAWATACMVMGHEQAIATIEKHPELGVFFVYTSHDGKIETYASPEIKPLIQQVP